MTEQELAERSPCPGPHRGDFPLGHARLTCPPASPPDLLQRPASQPRTAGAALLSGVPLTLTSPGWDSYSSQKGHGVKRAQRTFQITQDPFFEEQLLPRPARPSQHWLLESRRL